MNCRDIQDLLPAFREDILSPEEKRRITSHLSSCPFCSRSLADLKKAADLLKDLEEVEPPPFFEQRIMVQVQEEALREKGFLRKWFLPIHIKIPLQAMATVLIAVLAVYLYQKSEPEMKQIPPFSAPSSESTQSPPVTEAGKRPSAPSSVISQKEEPAERQPQDAQRFAPVPPQAGSFRVDGTGKLPGPKEEERPSTEKPGLPVPVLSEQEGPPVSLQLLEKSQEKVKKAKTRKTDEASGPERKWKGSLPDNGIGAEEFGGSRSAPASSRLKGAPLMIRAVLELTIQVREMTVAIREIDEVLSRLGARIMEKMDREGRVILKVELAAPTVPPFLDSLKGVGKVFFETKSPEVQEGRVILMIHLFPQS